MNKATKDYNYNGWWIVASELYNDWDLCPNGLTDQQHDDFRNNECITFDRLAEAKAWTKTEKAEQLKEKYVQTTAT